MPIDRDAIMPWTVASEADHLVLRRPIAPPDLIVGALYGGLALLTGSFAVSMVVRAIQFRSDPVGPWVLGVFAILALLVTGWALRALRSSVIRELDVSRGRLGLGQGGLLGLRRSTLEGTQIGGFRILHRHFDQIRDGEREDRRWTEMYLELPSMPDRFLGFFAGSGEIERERAAVEIADRLGVTPVIVHEQNPTG